MYKNPPKSWNTSNSKHTIKHDLLIANILFEWQFPWVTVFIAELQVQFWHCFWQWLEWKVLLLFLVLVLIFVCLSVFIFTSWLPGLTVAIFNKNLVLVWEFSANEKQLLLSNIAQWNYKDKFHSLVLFLICPFVLFREIHLVSMLEIGTARYSGSGSPHERIFEDGRPNQFLTATGRA